MKFSARRSPVAKAVRVLEFYVPSFGAAMLSGAPSADDACCSATALHGSGLSSGAPVAAATSAGVMRAHFGARYTWPRRCCAGCRTAAADHLLLETMGCAAVGRSFVMSSNSTEAWDAQESLTSRNLIFFVQRTPTISLHATIARVAQEGGEHARVAHSHLEREQ